MFFNFCCKCETYLISSMQGLTGVFSLRNQTAAQERRNVDLAASNTSLRKANVELTVEKKVLSFKLAELKLKNEDLEENYAELVKGNAKIIGEVDFVKDELAKEKVQNASLKVELETAVLKV